RWYQQRASDEAAGHRWSGIAVLVVGQVRAGTEDRVTRNIHQHVFQAMPTSRHHIFAVLEFTQSGFTWRGQNHSKRHYSRDFTDEQVKEMLAKYGGNYTLAEWTLEDVEREKDVYSSCTNQAKAGLGLAQQYLKFARALELMRKHEEADGQRFSLVLRIRPDIMYIGSVASALRYRLEEATAPVNSTIPFVCGSIGGGGGDAVLMVDRSAATVLGNVWRSLRGCRLENVDDCQSWPAIFGACLARPSPRHLRNLVREQCEHGWAPVFLRHGVPLPGFHMAALGTLTVASAELLRSLPAGLPTGELHHLQDVDTAGGTSTPWPDWKNGDEGGDDNFADMNATPVFHRSAIPVPRAEDGQVGLLPKMNVSEAVRSRRTCRAFEQRPVSQETIEELLSRASRAPSGGNTQPWHIYVVAGSKLRALTDAALAHLQGAGKQHTMQEEYHHYPRKAEMPSDMHEAYMRRRVQVAQKLWKLMGVARGDAAGRLRALLENYRFWGAPVGMIVTVDRCCDRNAWGHAGLLLQTIALLAVEQGLATAMLEAWGNLGSCVYDVLGISSDREVVWCGVALGYPDSSANLSNVPTDRLEVPEFCRFQGFVTSAKL
ncbi:cnbA, partial [Symbiodinium necroappetens]